MTIVYKCECCGHVFRRDWSDEEARAEFKEKFGDLSPDDVAIVCDDCFDKTCGGGDK